MLPYAAYLRVYEPLAAFSEPDRVRWARYAESAERPRRATALDAEHAQALRRLAAVPPVVVPPGESLDAYIRRDEWGGTYVCPWETRLRSWVAFDRFCETAPAGMTRSTVPDEVAGRAAGDFERWKQGRTTLRTYILSSTWHVPLAWFVPFAAPERWLGLGDTPARTLIYVTSMAQARQRVVRAITVVRTALGDAQAFGRVEELAHWLAGFHPRSLVELDYGGLVHLLSDQALCTDQSVAEVSVALAGMEQGEVELTVAMHSRLRARWRSVQALESAN